MISVLDYGLGNLGSIVNMLKKVGAEAKVISSVAELEGADKILLPGVGAFGNGMKQLDARGLVAPLLKRVCQDRVPVFGICLGMQLLAQSSEEGECAGLGLLDAHCRRFHFPNDRSLKVPHMGWNHIDIVRQHPLVNDLDNPPRFYFVHSYHMVCRDPAAVLATTRYGDDFVCIVQQGNIMGAQFHPEKSHRFGMSLLKNFAEL